MTPLVGRGLSSSSCATRWPRAARPRPGRGDRRGAGRRQVAARLGGHAGASAPGLAHRCTASAVSYGQATPYLPVIDLLKGYFRVEDRDDPPADSREGDGQLLALDPALEPNLPALLALLDVPVDDSPWQTLDPPQRRQRTLDAVKRLRLREAQVQPLLLVVEDLHWVDSETQALLDSLVESLPTARLLPPGRLPSRVSARLGQQDRLHAAPARPVAAGERRGAPRGAPRR